MLTCRAATSASQSPPSGSLPDPFRGRLLGPPPADQHWWDGLLFAGPLVVRTGPEQAARVGGKAWRMYYHGRDTEEWGMGVGAQPGTPFGRVGLAVSSDGITWERYPGPLPGGAVFDPSDDPSAFDSVHVGCSDVLLLPDGTWLLLYYAVACMWGAVACMWGAVACMWGAVACMWGAVACMWGAVACMWGAVACMWGAVACMWGAVACMWGAVACMWGAVACMWGAVACMWGAVACMWGAVACMWGAVACMWGAVACIWGAVVCMWGAVACMWGGLDPGRFPAWPAGKTALGARMRSGVATSADGVTWQRAKAPFLDVGDVDSWDELAVSWPRVTVQSSWQSKTGGSIGVPHNGSKWEGRTSEGGEEGGEGGGGGVQTERVEDAEGATAKDAVLSEFADMADADWLLTYQSVGDPHAPGHAHVWEDGEVDRVPDSLPQYCYTIGSAAFDPSKKTWTKKGSCIRRGSMGAWDEAGANRRHVVPLAAFGPKAVQKWEELKGQKEHREQQEKKEQQGGQKEDICTVGEGSDPPVLLMFYEGARYNGTYSIGLAYSVDGGETWEKARHVGPEPGGPILQPRFGEQVWDNLLVGTPDLIVVGAIGGEGKSEGGGEGESEGGGEGKSEGEVGSGRILMYYTGVGEVSGCGRVRGIGAAVWEGLETGDLSKWRRLLVD
ncbi:unnamed protein product [Closterium sp. NIES-65]|nr:unnamed protein product [Closterium sp. NIES-65]